MKWYVITMIGLLLILSSVLSALIIHEPKTPLRKVTLYNYDGKIIKEYDGKITYITRGNGGIKFWSDDKRVILQGGIIIVEDK